MNILWKYIKNYKLSFVSAILFLAAEAMIDLLQPTFLAHLIDQGVVEKDMQTILRTGFLMLSLTGLGALMATGRNFISSKVSQQVGSDLRKDVYVKIQHLEMNALSQYETGSLMTRMINDVNQLQNFIHGMMRVFVKAPLIAIGSLVMVYYLNPDMVWLLVLVIILAFTVIGGSMKLGYTYFEAVQKALDKVNIKLREYLNGIRVVKAFHRESLEVEGFSGVNEHLKDSTTKALRVMAFFSPLVALSVNLGIVGVLSIGALQVQAGGMAVGKLMAMVNYMIQLLNAMILIAMIFNVLVRTRASANRIGEVMGEESLMAEGEKVFEHFESLDVSHVAFAYSKEKWVLKDVNFQVHKGETLAIIGPTGSGKSSLLSLLLRFYDLEKGSIAYNGSDISQFDRKSLRKAIAYVPQKSILFTGSFTYNLKWAAPQATPADIEMALRAVDLYDFVQSLPQGLETMIGRGGVNLSGGQKQRMAIARALLSNPEVLLLDDATSAVDVTTEQNIRLALQKWHKPITVIMVVQRIAMAMHAHRIVVIENGQVQAIGTHDALCSAGGLYRELYELQIGKGVEA